MSKVICEICGTVYPDNATLCPICGYPRNIGENSASPSARAAAVGGQSAERVRGGKFSNSNVKKRNQPEAPVRREQSQERPRPRRTSRPDPMEDQPRRRTGAQAQSRPQSQVRTQPRPQSQQSRPQSHNQARPASRPQTRPQSRAKRSSNRGLVIAVVILLLAVIGVGGYIGLRFFRGADAYNKASTPSTGNTTEPVQTQPVETGVACTDILIADIDLDEGIEFQGMGRAWRLDVTMVPSNTTQEITYSSSDEDVATIGMNEGRVEILSIAPGTTTITITCGSVTKQFPVECNFQSSNGPILGGDSETDVDGSEEWFLSDEDKNIAVGESFVLLLENSSGAIADVTWESDSDGVSIEGNTITGVTSGEVARITCIYEGQTYECTVRVN